MEEKTSKLEDRVTAALVIHEEHMSDCHAKLKRISHMAWAKNQSNDTKKKFAKSLGRRGCTLAMFWNVFGITERRWAVEKKDEVWDDGREHGWRNGHEKKQNENYGRDETVVWWSELVILHTVLLKDVQKTVVVQQTQYIAVCHGKTNSFNLECSETVEDDLQNAVQRWSGQCPCRDALISTTFVSPSIYCNIFLNKILSTFFTFSLHIWKKSHVLLFSFENVFPWSSLSLKKLFQYVFHGKNFTFVLFSFLFYCHFPVLFSP